MSTIEFARAALPTFFTVLAMFYGARLLAGKHRFGIDLAADGKPATTQHITHSLFRVFRIAIWLICIARLVDPAVDSMIGVFPALMQPLPIAAGLGLLLLGFGWIAYVHNFMACEWRSGVSTQLDAHLLTFGPFARLRHPMFMGVMAAQLGFFFALPSVFSLVCLALGSLAIMAQARFEERWLEQRHGAHYREYRAATPGWLPRLARPSRPGSAA